MSFLKGLFDFITGGVGNKVVDKVLDLLPDNMSEADKQEFALKAKQIAHEEDMELQKIALQKENLFNQRIKDLEGTASDLKSIPIIGPIVIFLRGAYRPLFAYAIAFVDLQVFSGLWKLEDEKIASAFWLANLIVLAFYFGERAIINIMPLAERYFGVNKTKNKNEQ